MAYLYRYSRTIVEGDNESASSLHEESETKQGLYFYTPFSFIITRIKAVNIDNHACQLGSKVQSHPMTNQLFSMKLSLNNVISNKISNPAQDGNSS